MTAKEYIESGRTKADDDDFGGAIADFTRAIELDPASHSALRDRGLALRVQGDYAGALADYLRANEVDPMGDSDPCYRDLYDLMINYEGTTLHESILAPWVAPLAGRESRWLRSLALRQGDPVPAADRHELEQLYALSRVNELLLYGLQPPPRDGREKWTGPPVTLQQYRAFVEAMGLSVVTQPDFSPFHYEIVAVEETADEDHPIAITETVWPCLMLGPMLFSRAGVKVKGGARFICKEAAESSILHWSHRRRNRETTDLSKGWGSNSQWGTAFRRDYRFGDSFHYNVDGKYDVFEPDPEDPGKLTTAERIELLTHRCFITNAKYNDEEMFPYHDTCKVIES
jgi:hypothetical protein